VLIDGCSNERTVLQIVAEIRCGTVVVGHRALSFSPLWLHCARVDEIAVVLTALGFHIIVGAVKIN
jgi:hypothetical protein